MEIILHSIFLGLSLGLLVINGHFTGLHLIAIVHNCMSFFLYKLWYIRLLDCNYLMSWTLCWNFDKLSTVPTKYIKTSIWKTQEVSYETVLVERSQGWCNYSRGGEGGKFANWITAFFYHVVAAAVRKLRIIQSQLRWPLNCLRWLQPQSRRQGR